MTMAAIAIGSVAAAVIGAGVSLYTTEKAEDATYAASKKAAAATKEAAESASNTELEMFYQNREDLAPWRTTGETALNKINNYLSGGDAGYTKSAGYDFQVSEGEKSINRALASRGQYDSGKALKAITEYNQDYASTDYQNYLSNLYNLANMGLGATETTTSEGTTTASEVASNTLYAGTSAANAYTNAGEANASSYINSGNAISSATDSGISNYLLYKYLNNGS